MKGDAANLRRVDVLQWSIVAAVGVVVLIASLVGGFQPVWTSFLAPAGACALLGAGIWYYEALSPDPRLSSALNGTGLIVAFAAVAAPLSYIAASAGLPLQDRLFDVADRAIGLNWRDLLHWMNNASALHPLFGLAYQSFTVQASVAILALAFSGRIATLRVFTLAFMVATIVTIVISALLPAEGVWGYYNLNAADYPAIHPVTRELHLPIFHGLRDGSYRALTAIGASGIITFPSLHAAVALLFIFALWPVPVLRWLSLVVNVIMIAATPVDGGHYFIDVVAGLALAAVCWVGAAAVVERSRAARSAPMFAAGRKSRLAPGE